MTLKEIALELLEKYKEAELTVIWEYSGDTKKSEQILEAECEAYRQAIEKHGNS